MTRPNILYLHSHDTGRHVQPYGYAVPTPNLQRLAEQGVMFRNAHCVAPTCSPSRAALLTGQSAHGCGMLGLAHRGFVLSDYSHHLNFTLKPAGYHTVLASFQHVARLPFADPKKVLGYDEHLMTEDFKGAENAASKFLAGKPQQPFFLDVGFFETHRHGPPDGTFVDPAKPIGDPRFVRPPEKLPDTPDTRRDFADFAAAAAVLDRKMGVVLDALAAAGLAENTLVICTTDHGIPFPGAKCCLTDHGTGVMLFLRGPGGFTGGRVIDPMVSHLDLFPTICELCDIAPPPWLEGKSLTPLIRGEVKQLHEELFAEVTYHAAYEPKRSIRTPRCKYIRRYTQRDGVTLANMDDGLSKSVLVNAGWHKRPPAMESLYDLSADPQEANNLAGDENHRDVLNLMRARLDDWMKRTNDPLFAGDVPPPPGAIVTASDAYSPSGKSEVGPYHSFYDDQKQVVFFKRE